MQTLQQLCEVSHDAPFMDQETERRTLGRATGGVSPSLGAAFPVSPHIPLTLRESTYTRLLSACRVPGRGDPEMSELGAPPSRNPPPPGRGDRPTRREVDRRVQALERPPRMEGHGCRRAGSGRWCPKRTKLGGGGGGPTAG